MSAVYFAKVGDFVKIGFSTNPRRRLDQLGDPQLAHPDGFDATAEPQLILVIPFCRMRDERNMHLLFAHHWTGAGEWFHWTPAFEHQMATMQFVTHGARLMDLRRARRDLGVSGGRFREIRWGKSTAEILAEQAAS